MFAYPPLCNAPPFSLSTGLPDSDQLSNFSLWAAKLTAFAAQHTADSQLPSICTALHHQHHQHQYSATDLRRSSTGDPMELDHNPSPALPAPPHCNSLHPTYPTSQQHTPPPGASEVADILSHLELQQVSLRLMTSSGICHGLVAVAGCAGSGHREVAAQAAALTARWRAVAACALEMAAAAMQQRTHGSHGAGEAPMSWHGAPSTMAV